MRAGVRRNLALGLGIFLGCWAGTLHSQDRISFPQDIRPILSDNCFFCHGPDASRREAGLRLDLEPAAKDYAIVPGAAEDSELFARITAEDAELRMPPAGTKLSLSARDIDLMGRWIDQGAEWNEHWSFLPPRDVVVPAVRQESWCRNEIDRFILQRLEAEGLSPSPAASR